MVEREFRLSSDENSKTTHNQTKPTPSTPFARAQDGSREDSFSERSRLYNHVGFVGCNCIDIERAMCGVERYGSLLAEVDLQRKGLGEREDVESVRGERGRRDLSDQNISNVAHDDDVDIIDSINVDVIVVSVVLERIEKKRRRRSENAVYVAVRNDGIGGVHDGQNEKQSGDDETDDELSDDA